MVLRAAICKMEQDAVAFGSGLLLQGASTQGSIGGSCSADVGRSCRYGAKLICASEHRSQPLDQLPEQTFLSPLSMSGETANKAQAHIDAVSRAKNERLERHAGEALHKMNVIIV